MSKLGSLVSRGMIVLMKLWAELYSNLEMFTMPEFMPLQTGLCCMGSC